MYVDGSFTARAVITALIWRVYHDKWHSAPAGSGEAAAHPDLAPATAARLRASSKNHSMKPHELAEQMLAAEQAKKAEVRRLSAEKIQQRRLKRAQVQANRAKNDIDQLRALVEKQEKDETDQALAAAATYTAEQRRKQLRKLKQQKEAEAQHKAAASRQEAEARKQVRLEASQRRKDKAAQAAEAKRPGRAGKGNPQRKARRPAAAQTGQAVAGVASAREQLPPSSAVMAQVRSLPLFFFFSLFFFWGGGEIQHFCVMLHCMRRLLVILPVV